MLKSKLSVLLIAIFSLMFIKNVEAQLSTKHYIPPITSNGNGTDITEQFIYISTPSTSDVSFTVKTIGSPANDYNGTVSRSNPFLYRIVEVGQDPGDASATLDTDGDSQLAISEFQSNTRITDRGYIIEASDVVYVSVRFRSSSPNYYQAGALVSKGLSALGTEFRAGGMARDSNISRPGYLTYISVMATENNTTVLFNDFSPGIKIINNAVGATPITTPLLNEGDSYLIAVAHDDGGIPNHLIGTRISSDKPIVVNSGSGTGSFSNSNPGRDFGIDQIVGSDKVGKEYIFVKGNGGNGPGNAYENVLIIANTDNTNVFINT